MDSLSIIEEAYQKKCVDESIVGGYSNVKYELGLSDQPPQVQLFVEESTGESGE